MTITEAVDYVRNIHNASGDSNWSDSEIYKLFEAKANEALSVVGLVESKSTFTSTSGTADYSFTTAGLTNAVRIRRLRYSGIALKQITFRQYEARVVSGTAPSGTPREFLVWNNTITLLPTPSTSSDTITVFFESKQSSITSSSSTLDVPEPLHYALCDGVIAMMYAKDLNAAMADRFLNLWREHKQDMREFVKRRRRTGSAITVVDTDSSLETEFGVI